LNDFIKSFFEIEQLYEVINSKKSTIEKIKGILVDLLQIYETKSELDSKQLKAYRKAIEENSLSTD